MKVQRRTWTMLFVLLAALLGGLPGRAAAQDINNSLPWWMSYVADAASLADLTIPGTHDTGALYEPVAGTATCQTLGIRDQLNIGIRYLDIRLRQIDNALVVHHGAVYQRQNFDDVLRQVVSFLATNPSETVLMEVSSEHTPANNTESYEQTFMRYVNNGAYSAYWWRQGHVPTMGEVRGRIVLLRRFAGSAGTAGGIDVTGWRDNATFTLADNRGRQIAVQDNYQVSFGTNNNKWNAIEAMLNQAAADTTGRLHINFSSGYRSILGIPNIPSVSNDINARLNSYFAVAPSHTHHGVIVSDFVTRAMVQQLLRPYFH